MQYRPMQLSDYGALMQLWRSCAGLLLRDADSIQSIERYLLRNPGLSFVAEEEGTIVGSLMAGHDGRRGYIQHLAVAPALRNRGVASRLVEHCLAALKAEGIVKSHVHVLSSNQTGQDFWLRRGWIRRGETRLYSFINGGSENA
jgi:ribosomal protein S18 acetylase RimI-like enzyme